MKTIPALKERYQPYFDIGAAVTPAVLIQRGELVRAQFSSLTAENQMKPEPIHPQPEQWRFADADAIAAFARDNGLHLRGHTLVWHAQTPRWFFDGADRDTLLSRVRGHMQTMFSRYAKDVIAWDVVNEAVEDKTSAVLRDSLYHQIIGDDLVVQSFAMARQLLPDGYFVYNDYNELVPEKRTKILTVLDALNSAGHLADAVGMQCHWNIRDLDLDELRRSLDLYAAKGVHIQITELDLSLYGSEDKTVHDAATPENLALQAELYGRIFAIFRQYHEVIDSVTFWGVTDEESWMKNFPVPGRGYNKPLLFGADGQPKECFWHVAEF